MEGVPHGPAPSGAVTRAAVHDESSKPGIIQVAGTAAFHAFHEASPEITVVAPPVSAICSCTSTPAADSPLRAAIATVLLPATRCAPTSTDWTTRQSLAAPTCAPLT